MRKFTRIISIITLVGILRVLVCQTINPHVSYAASAAESTETTVAASAAESTETTVSFESAEPCTPDNKDLSLNGETEERSKDIGVNDKEIIASSKEIIASSKETGIVYFDKAKDLLLKNNSTLQNQKKSLKDYKEGYEKALAAADEIEDQDFLNAPNHYFRMFLYKTTELIPEQSRYALNQAEANIKAYERQLTDNLRNHFQALLSGSNNIEVQKRKYLLCNRAHSINIEKHRNNLITNLELEESEYDKMRSQMALFESVRNYENACRSFNLYIGAPINTFYNQVECENQDETLLGDITFYYEEALKNRPELKSIEEQIQLKKLEMDILERNQIYQFYTAVKKEHESIQVSISSLYLDLEKTKLNIKKEIYQAFVDVINGEQEIKKAERLLSSLKRKMDLAEARYKAGVIPEMSVLQMEIEIYEGELAVKNAVCSYNTKIKRLYNIAGLSIN